MKTPSFVKSFSSLLPLLFFALVFAACDDDDVQVNDSTQATIFLSSNTSGEVGVVNAEKEELEAESFEAASEDADGIYYDSEMDMLYQVDRSNSRLVAYNELDADDASMSLLDISISLISTSNFQNGRGLAVQGDIFIVAQDGSDLFPNQFVVYQRNGNQFDFVMNMTTDINLWGIQLVGEDLYAIVDNSNKLAIFNNFLANEDDAMVSPDAVITIEGIVRTHGLEYDETDDVLVLTDVGDADSDSDGAILFIENWSDLRSNTTIKATNYTRIAGDNTMLGNPVDMEYDAFTDMAYVAERKRNGGLLLAFSAKATGNVMPDRMSNFAGASSIFLSRE